MMNQSQSGSAHVIIIAVLTVGLMSALGWIFYQNVQKTDSAESAVTTKAKPDTKKS